MNKILKHIKTDIVTSGYVHMLDDMLVVTT